MTHTLSPRGTQDEAEEGVNHLNIKSDCHRL